ncbi:MAG: hypothetical protein IT260_23855 [Saprospiraceae bacterium]|nr:hypothetical protein [Saprospiraceae bacterium]
MSTPFRLVLAFAALAAWTAMVQHHPFFWDTVQLASKHAHFFYDNSLQWAPLPPEIDSGHPPVFGYMLAVAWTFFGKTLPISHWMMWPVLCGIVALLLRLGVRLGGAAKAWWLPALAIADPVLAGQSVLVSPDLVLVLCLLLALEGVLDGRFGWLLLGVLGLCMISMRGMMTAAALFAWCSGAYFLPAVFPKVIWRYWLAFLPGFAFGAWFLTWHLAQTGWIGYHAGSPWAQAFATSEGWGLLRNVLVIGWRWTDVGRVFEWLLLLVLLARWWRHGAGAQKEAGIDVRVLLSLLACLAIFLSPSALLYQNLSAHRYFLPLFLALHMLVLGWVAQTRFPKGWTNLALGALFAGLLTGNGWIYPRGISMDWDSTLAHLPYYRLRADFMRYLEENQLDFQNIGTAFPNINSGEVLLLDGDHRIFQEKDFSRNSFVWTSNIFNDFSEEDYQLLSRDWVLIKRQESAGVWMELYRRK